MSLRRSSAAVLAAVLLCPFPGVAQSDTLLVEIAAAKVMQRHQYANGELGLDPQSAEAGRAPGLPFTARPSARTQTIARAIHASVRAYSEVRNCGTATRCQLHGVVAHLILSEPSITADTATITATIWQNSSGVQPVNYESTLIVLRRQGGVWAVIREEQLGIS